AHLHPDAAPADRRHDDRGASAGGSGALRRVRRPGGGRRRRADGGAGDGPRGAEEVRRGHDRRPGGGGEPLPGEDRLLSTIWLVGVMGVGKTSAGRLAAQRLGVPFSDTDEMVERQAGATIPAIWRVHGEEGFRALEARAVEAAAETGGVVATGGGAVLSEANRGKMTGTVSWPSARPGTTGSATAGPRQAPCVAARGGSR